MSVIYNRTFASGNQRYLTLTNEDYLRPLSIGTNWNRIRIGMLYALSTVSENAWPIRACSLGLGVCAGKQASPMTLSSPHAFGFSVVNELAVVSPTNTFGYNAGTSGNSYFSASGWLFLKVAAGVRSTSGTGSVTIVAPSNTTLGGALARRGLLIVDIAKSALISGNITQGVMSGAAAHAALDLTSSDLYSSLEWYSSAPTIQGTALNFLAVGNTLTFNETTNGGLDTVYLYWNLFTVPLQLYELAVYRVG